MGPSKKGVTPLQEYCRHKVSIQNCYVTCALAEFLGTYIVVLFSVAVGCQSTLLQPAFGEFGVWLMSLIGGGMGVMMGVAVTGGLSGGHVNPAVSIAAAISGSLSWIRVPVYILAQFVGAYFGAGTAYGLYTTALKKFYADMPCSGDLTECIGLAGVFAPLPKSDLGVAFADQTISTAVFVLVILAACDPRNMKVPQHIYPFLFALAVAGINCAFGVHAGGVLNPARDIAARLMAVTVGFDADKVFVFAARTHLEEQYWVAPLFGPIMGGILAALIYNFMIGAHLHDDAPATEFEPYVPNRFNVRVNTAPEHVQMAQTSQKAYAPSQAASLPSYRGGGY